MIAYEVVDNIPEIDVQMARAWTLIGEHMIQSIQRNFDEQGRPTKWPPPSRNSLFTSGTLLKRRGDLYNSGTFRFTEDECVISWGLGLPYAWIQNFGGTTHPVVSEKMKRFFWAMYMQSEDEFWKFMALKPVGEVLNITIPARTFMTIQPEDKEFIVSTLKSGVILHYPDGRIESIQ